MTTTVLSKVQSQEDYESGTPGGSSNSRRAPSSLVYPWNSPIPIVFVEGDSAEMGKQFAKQTKNITRKNVNFNLPLLEKIIAKSRIKKKDYVKEVEQAVSEFTSSEYLDEMSSIADAAGLPYESLVLLNSNSDIINTLPDTGSKERFFCSVVAAWGRATQDGATIAGHNDDGGRFMDQYAVLKVASPKRGNKFVCPQVPGYLGYDCFVNSRQVLVCGTAVDDSMKNGEAIRGGVPNWILYRWLGQYSQDADDAVKRLLSAKPMTLKNWCFVSKGSGKVVEATPKHHAFMRYPSKSRDWFALSTCTVCPEIAKHTVKSSSPTSGVYRIASVKREVSKRYGGIDPDSAVEVLSSHYDSKRHRTLPSEDTPCRHMEYENRFAGTCRSLVATFDGAGEPSTRIDVALGNPCSCHWRRLYFDKEFDLASGFDSKDPLERELNRMLAVM